MDDNDIVLMPAQKKSKKKIIILLSVVIVLIIATIFLVINFMIMNDRNARSVDVVNSSDELSQVPQDEIDSFEFMLCTLLKDRFGISDCADVVAIVREDSAEYSFDNDDEPSFEVDFLLDIDEYEQTYDVKLWWLNHVEFSENASVECPRSELMKYPEAECLGMSTTSKSVSIYLPYESDLSSGESISVRESYIDVDGVETLKIDVNNCGSEEIIDSAIENVKKWLVSIGLEPNNYKYSVPLQYDHCLIR